jgi:hypothetical protein
LAADGSLARPLPVAREVGPRDVVGTAFANCYNHVKSAKETMMAVADAQLDVHTASQHLWEALSHHQITMDVSAQDPLVMAISAYGQACRERDQEKIDAASRHVWEELSKHKTTLDLGADDPVVKALAEYGEACRREGVK